MRSLLRRVGGAVLGLSVEPTVTTVAADNEIGDGNLDGYRPLLRTLSVGLSVGEGRFEDVGGRVEIRLRQLDVGVERNHD